MTNFTSNQTNETINISVIDPATGADCINDLLQIEHDQIISLDADFNWVADSDTIEYYQSMSSQYQIAYDLIYEIKQFASVLQKEKLEKILADAQWYETNDWAGYIIKDITDNKLV